MREMQTESHKEQEGKGNIIITSADVASALQMAGVLDYDKVLTTI